MKHESAYAVFNQYGRIYFPSIRQTEDAAIKVWGNPQSWPLYQERGYTVRQVTVTEVKDDD